MILDEDVEFVKLLIGSPVNFTAITDPWSEDGGNALHFAARRLKNKMIDLLLEHSMDIGIDFNDRNDLGETALHIIAKRKTCTPCVQNILNIQCTVFWERSKCSKSQKVEVISNFKNILA